jgi:hypothetical protein
MSCCKVVGKDIDAQVLQRLLFIETYSFSPITMLLFPTVFIS